MLSASEALVRLQAGNRRFAADAPFGALQTSSARRGALAGGQAPFAVVLGCSDSRVPVELVFDQGLGDLFVIRVAGNIIAPSLIGSVEFAAERFGTQLVVVLGHSHCGAIAATLEALQQPAGPVSPNLLSIVERIRPSVADLLATDLRRDPAALAHAAGRANIRASVQQLRAGSASLQRLSTEGRLVIVGAEYALDSGVVDFFDNPPPADGAR